MKVDKSECEIFGIFGINVFYEIFLKREHLKIAQQYFQLVGGSASECGMLGMSTTLLPPPKPPPPPPTLAPPLSIEYLAVHRYYSWATMYGLLFLLVEAV
jgi:hypothetical protein